MSKRNIRALSVVVALAVSLCEAASPEATSSAWRVAPAGGRRSSLSQPDTFSTTLGFLDWVFVDAPTARYGQTLPTIFFSGVAFRGQLRFSETPTLA